MLLTIWPNTNSCHVTNNKVKMKENKSCASVLTCQEDIKLSTHWSRTTVHCSVAVLRKTRRSMFSARRHVLLSPHTSPTVLCGNYAALSCHQTSGDDSLGRHTSPRNLSSSLSSRSSDEFALANCRSWSCAWRQSQDARKASSASSFSLLRGGFGPASKAAETLWTSVNDTHCVASWKCIANPFGRIRRLYSAYYSGRIEYSVQPY